MTYDKVQKYIELAYDIFGYFNGEINRVNRDITIVISPETHVKRYGDINLHSKLVLYIYNIIEKADNDIVVKNNILYTIIHELFHADQFMDIVQYQYNLDYADKIEREVNYMTGVYVLTNKVILEERFNFKIIESGFRAIMSMNDCGQALTYSRCDLFQYYYTVLKDTIQVLEKLSDSFFNASDIELYCDNDMVIIKKDNKFNEDTRLFNRLINNLSKYNKQTADVDAKKNNGVVTIVINTVNYRSNLIELLEV